MSTVPKISLLLADVDGTLVTHDKVLTARAREAVMRLHGKGILFAITSGRPPRGMAMLIDPLAVTLPIAGFNGGAYVAPDMRLLESHTLSPAAAQKAVALLDSHRLDCWLYTGDNWYIRNPDAPHVARESRTVAFAATVVADFDGLFADAVKVVGVSDDASRMATAENEVAATLRDDVSVSLSQPYYLDITNAAANKAAVVRYHASRLGIPASQIATIGDMPNDVLMFEASGYSIAMGNAAPEVQARAKTVTDSCDNEGFAKAVERHLLGGS